MIEAQRHGCLSHNYEGYAMKMDVMEPYLDLLRASARIQQDIGSGLNKIANKVERDAVIETLRNDMPEFLRAAEKAGVMPATPVAVAPGV